MSSEIQIPIQAQIIRAIELGFTFHLFHSHLKLNQIIHYSKLSTAPHMNDSA